MTELPPPQRWTWRVTLRTLDNRFRALIDVIKGRPWAKFLLVIALIIGVPWAACEMMYPNIYVRYRLTVQIEDNGQVKTGSGVVEIRYPIIPDIPIEGGNFRGFLRGNAITIDLGSKGLIFVVSSPAMILHISRSHSLTTLPLAAYGFPAEGLSSAMKPILRRLQRKSYAVDVPVEMLPMMIRFVDINDLYSAREVDPTDLTGSFGPGVRLIAATLQITDDSITSIPASWPAWLVDAKTAAIGVPTKIKGRPLEILRLHDFKGE